MAKKVIGNLKLRIPAGRATAGKITKAQLQEIAEAKMEHLNAVSLEGAMKTIAGTARSMGVEITE